MIKQNPFSLYDFLGYLIPGSTFLYFFLVFEKIVNKKTEFNIESIISITSKIGLDEYFVFIIISYSFGHLVSFISSITIEKYGNWKYGYPSKTIIGFEKKSYWVLDELNIDKNESKFFSDFDSDKKKRKYKNTGRTILMFLILPVYLFDLFFGEKLKLKNFYSKGLDEFTMDIIKQKTILLLNSISEKKRKKIKVHDLKEIDFNRIVHHYVFENCKEHQFRMVNYVALYGFLRNLVLIFISFFWCCIYVSFKSINFNSNINWDIVSLILILMFLSYVSFMAYMKFYRRYTLEGLMLLTIINLKKESNFTT